MTPRSNPARLTVNPVVLLVLSLCLVSGQLLFLSAFPRASAGERAILTASMLLHSSVLITGVILLCGFAARHLPVWAGALLWAGASLSSTFWFWDYFSYAWLALHLNEAFGLLAQNARTDFRVMPTKMAGLVLTLVANVVFLVGGGWFLAFSHRRFPRMELSFAAHNVGRWCLVSLLLLSLNQTVASQLLAPATLGLSRDALCQLWIGWPRTASSRHAAFEIDAPRFRRLPDEPTIQAVLASEPPAPPRTNLNIFLFVVDSLRADMITETVAPNLFHLQMGGLKIQRGVAAGNCTHISWCSILHGVPPLFWSVVMHPAHSDGAIPIRILKKAGYRVNVLSTPRLDYFGFARSVFAENHVLADTFVDQAAILNQLNSPSVGDMDSWVMRRLCGDLDRLEPGSRAFYLVRVDAPHHEYSWAKDYPPRFVPFMESVPLNPGAVTSEKVALIKNRYQNAVHFEDALLGRFLEKLKARGLLNSSIIVVTGDHGEEFLEQGHLTHSSELNAYQLEVPIIIHVPGYPAGQAGEGAAAPVASHPDIFPTIFGALGLETVSHRLLGGRSLLEGTSGGGAVSAQCSSFSPHRILVDDGDRKLLIDLEGIGKLGKTLYARRLVATRLLDAGYREIPLPQTGAAEIEGRFQPGLRTFLADEADRR